MLNHVAIRWVFASAIPSCPNHSSLLWLIATASWAKPWMIAWAARSSSSALRELAVHPHPNQVYGAFTVREEIGRPNSALSGWSVSPDICFILEVGLPADTPATPPDQQTSDRLGGGVTLVIYDEVLLANAPLLQFVLSVAEEHDIPCQLATIGGNTAGKTVATTAYMHDVPSLCLGVPLRYAHSHNSLMCLRDYQLTLSLLSRLLQRLDEQALVAIRQG